MKMMKMNGGALCALKKKKSRNDTLVTIPFSINDFAVELKKRCIEKNRENRWQHFVCLFVCICVFFPSLWVKCVDRFYETTDLKCFFLFFFFCVFVQFNENVIYDVVRSMIDDNYKIAWMQPKKPKSFGRSRAPVHCRCVGHCLLCLEGYEIFIRNVNDHGS